MSKKTTELLLDLHGLVRAGIRGHPFLLAPVRREFSSFLVPRENASPGTLDLELVLELEGKSSGTTPAAAARSPAFAGAHLFARWQGALEMEGGSLARVRFRGNRLSRFIAAKWIVEPALRVRAEEKGALMLHAACLADQERGIIVAGPGGAGKTTWAISWAAAGHPFFGDDFAFLKEGRAYPYLTPLRLSAGSLLSQPELARILPLRAVLEIIARTMARRASGARAKLYYKARPEDLFPGRLGRTSVEVAAAVWLETTAGGKPARARALSPAAFAALAAGADREEMHGFAEQPSPSKKAGDNDAAAEPPEPEKEDALPSPLFWKRHEQKILELLRDKPCYAVPTGLRPPSSALASLESLLQWLSSESEPRRSQKT